MGEKVQQLMEILKGELTTPFPPYTATWSLSPNRLKVKTSSPAPTFQKHKHTTRALTLSLSLLIFLPSSLPLPLYLPPLSFFPLMQFLSLYPFVFHSIPGSSRTSSHFLVIQ